MLNNIIDSRKHKYLWRNINVVAEATCHDNSCHNSDKVPSDDFGYCEYVAGVSVQQAIEWATALPVSVTLYLYDYSETDDED